MPEVMRYHEGLPSGIIAPCQISGLVFLKDLHTAEGKSFEERQEASDRTSTPAWKNGGCAAGDWAYMSHGDLKLLWIVHDKKVKTLDISGGPDIEPKCQTWSARGMPSIARYFGAAWTFSDAKGNHHVYVANNDKRLGQILAIDSSSIDTKALTVGLEKMPWADPIEVANDGVSCMNAPSPWPTKEVKAEVKVEEPAPKAGYEWVLMGESTVCRADKGDHDTMPDSPSITLAHAPWHLYGFGLFSFPYAVRFALILFVPKRCSKLSCSTSFVLMLQNRSFYYAPQSSHYSPPYLLPPPPPAPLAPPPPLPPPVPPPILPSTSPSSPHSPPTTIPNLIQQSH